MSETTESAAQSPASGNSSAAVRVELREVLRMVDRRKWHIAGIALLIVSLTSVVVAQLTPEYRASALVMLDTRKFKVTNTTDVLSGPAFDVSVIQTEIEILRSASLLGRVVDKLHLDQDAEFGAAPPGWLSVASRQVKSVYGSLTGVSDAAPVDARSSNPARSRAIEAIARNMTAATRNRSYVIEVSVDSVDPAKAKVIVDAITDYYIVDQLQAKVDATKRATEFFNDRLDELKQNLAKAERAVATYRDQAGLTIGRDSTLAAQSLSELTTQLIQARGQRADKESRLIALKAASGRPATLGGITEVISNPLISQLRAQEAEVSRRIGDLNQRYGASHPRLLQAGAELGQIEARISAEVTKIIASVQGDAEAARSKEQQLQAQLDLLEHAAGGLGQSEVQLRQLEREAQSGRAVYEDFLKRFKEVREQQDIQQPDARVLSASTVPNAAVFPRYRLTIIVSGIAGVLLGILFVIMLERLDGGFRSGAQIERMTGLAMVGMIPALSKGTMGSLLPAAFVIEKPTSAYAEALRSTYTAITLGSLDSPPRVIMVTSSLPAEGKSTFVCSLAGLMARSSPDKKIVVVDCDLRRSAILKTLKLPPTGGTVDEYLTGVKTLEQVIGRDAGSGLYYIPARSNTPNSAEILDSNAMGNFVRSLSASFDLVFLDTPPLMAVSDTRVTAKLADYIVFLVRWESTAREAALNSIKLLKDARKPTGVVLSQVNLRKHSRYGYGDYGYYYSKYRDYYSG